MKIATVAVNLLACTTLFTSSGIVEGEKIFCQSEVFRPRCLPGEVVIISKAVYGRMSGTGRCLQDEEELPTLKDDPKYMGCYEDVLRLVSAICSGQSSCEIRIPDPEMERTNPCYRHMAKYLEVAHYCVSDDELMTVAHSNRH